MIRTVADLDDSWRAALLMLLRDEHAAWRKLNEAAAGGGEYRKEHAEWERASGALRSGCVEAFGT